MASLCPTQRERTAFGQSQKEQQLVDPQGLPSLLELEALERSQLQSQCRRRRTWLWCGRRAIRLTLWLCRCVRLSFCRSLRPALFGRTGFGQAHPTPMRQHDGRGFFWRGLLWCGGVGDSCFNCGFSFRRWCCFGWRVFFDHRGLVSRNGISRRLRYNHCLSRAETGIAHQRFQSGLANTQ